MSGFIMWLAAVAVAAALALGVAAVGTAAIEHAQAGAAADAAALAGAAGGQDAALRATQRNDAELISFRERGAVFTVVVRVGQSSAQASAERILVAQD